MFGKLRPNLAIIGWMLIAVIMAPTLCRAEAPRAKLEPQTLDTLLEALKLQEPRRIPYLEFRIIPALKAPLQSKGFLEFIPPETLIKSVELPIPSTYVLSSTEIKVTDGSTGESHSLGPEAIPELSYIRSCLTGLLSADKAALLAHWRVSLGGTHQRWTLNFVPIDRDLSGLHLVTLEGQANVLKKIHIEALDGSTSNFILGTP